ncbi:antibiotic biosynthesis monooxygenase [Pseudarthrobacter sp. NIBRBAC000502770]|uniref:antibiotic biosynthesis monooxygenase family protein n=1 Tax=Pseudarthrobacter sp. NIBRBAC000502770 TaxID=2590785 RepID=UPI0011409271|nr:antibiotic biosynthesis monooxygenase [Pseudarthrobacter sp. NIBRBAC000502770]QDG88174.1 antibiotic biosynthesis monooxygenase [Pseudarthrobacter sp. NIBRBAC000502770]
MIHEIATLTIKPGSEKDFEEAAAQAVPYFQKTPGALSFRLDRTIETPNEYTLTVGWATLEDHTVGFRESPEFQQWRELVGPHFASPPHVKHLQHAYVGF